MVLPNSHQKHGQKKESEQEGVYRHLLHHPCSHAGCNRTQTFPCPLCSSARLKQTKKPNPSHIFDLLVCGATQALAVASPGPVPQLHYSTFIFSLEHSLVGPQVCLYAPKPTALFCCCFSPSISSASYSYA